MKRVKEKRTGKDISLRFFRTYGEKPGSGAMDDGYGAKGKGHGAWGNHYRASILVKL